MKRSLPDYTPPTGIIALCLFNLIASLFAISLAVLTPITQPLQILFYLTATLLSVLVAIELWRLRKWAYWFTLTVQFFNIVSAFLNGNNLLPFVALAIIIYLLRPKTRDAFQIRLG
jgi:hypothetical protein